MNQTVMNQRSRGDRVAPSQLLRYGIALRSFWAANPLATIADALAAVGAPRGLTERLHVRLVSEGRVPRLHARRTGQQAVP